MTLYRDALRYRYMVTQKALRKAKILAFAEKYGLETTLEAFEVKRRTFFDWKRRWVAGGKIPEALNAKSRAPRVKRKRLWPDEVIAEIKRLRFAHPNLGKEKLYPELHRFCLEKQLHCPQPKTHRPPHPRPRGPADVSIEGFPLRRSQANREETYPEET